MDSNNNPVTAISSWVIMAKLLSEIGVPVQAVYGATPDLVPDGPLIAFRRTGLSTGYTKAAANSEATVEVWIYHPDYVAGVELAERVRAAIEGRSGKTGGLILTRATLADASEDFTGDKYVQILTFLLQINSK